MSVLIDNLSRWRGREHTEKLIEDRGFAVHRIGQTDLIDYCRTHTSGDECDLGTYWSEVARELVCSARQIKVYRREFPAHVTYRSSYLDDLARRMAHTSSPFPTRLFIPAFVAVSRNRMELCGKRSSEKREVVKSRKSSGTRSRRRAGPVSRRTYQVSWPSSLMPMNLSRGHYPNCARSDSPREPSVKSWKVG